jgi:hypothetical protein
LATRAQVCGNARARLEMAPQPSGKAADCKSHRDHHGVGHFRPAPFLIAESRVTLGIIRTHPSPAVLGSDSARQRMRTPPPQKTRGPKARARTLKTRRGAFPSVLLALANFALEPGRQGRKWSADVGERAAQLAEDHQAIRIILQKHRQSVPSQAGPPITMIPFVVTAYHLSKILWKVARKPHRKSLAFVEATRVAQEDLEAWEHLTVGREAGDAWAFNIGAAEAWLENLRHVHSSVLALVRCCQNTRGPARFFLLRSGPREPRFCPRPGCRQAFHRERTSSTVKPLEIPR